MVNSRSFDGAIIDQRLNEVAAGYAHAILNDNIAENIVRSERSRISVFVDEPVAPAFQRQRIAAVFILPAFALAADELLRGVVILIDRLTPGRYGDAAGSHLKVGIVVLEVQHNIFAHFGGKRVVTTHIRSLQAAVVLFAVDVLDRVIINLYGERRSSGKVNRTIGPERFCVSK